MMTNQRQAVIDLINLRSYKACLKLGNTKRAEEIRQYCIEKYGVDLENYEPTHRFDPKEATRKATEALERAYRK